MVERHGPQVGKEMSYYKMKLLNNSQARVLLKMIPNFGEEFQHFNVNYLSKLVNMNYSYVQEIVDFFCDKDIVEFDGENYFLSQDNLWKVQDTLNKQAMIVLLRKIEALEGSNKII